MLPARNAAPHIPDKTTSHQVELPGGSLVFHAQVSTHHTTESDGFTESDMVTTAFMLDGTAPDTRPVGGYVFYTRDCSRARLRHEGEATARSATTP